jgi:hypothetical protein
MKLLNSIAVAACVAIGAKVQAEDLPEKQRWYGHSSSRGWTPIIPTIPTSLTIPASLTTTIWPPKTVTVVLKTSTTTSCSTSKQSSWVSLASQSCPKLLKNESIRSELKCKSSLLAQPVLASQPRHICPRFRL